MPESIIELGDSLKLLECIEDNTFDALVTDPPAGIGFMGREWDSDRGGRVKWIDWMSSVMAECLRVMKPGAHGLIWALPRTSHWTGMALENAGFEIRDCVYHVFGSGFPKSMNISKATDKSLGMNGRVVAEYEEHNICRPKGGGNERLMTSKGNRETRLVQKRAPGSDEARQWEGWGTALKPAVECWWLVRKPLSEKTIVANVLKWGTGALNIDGCRVGPDFISGGGNNFDAWRSGENRSDKPGIHGKTTSKTQQGRFPAHLIHDGSDEVVGMFPESKPPWGKGKSISKSKSWKQSSEERPVDNGKYQDENHSAARFFYCAKPSRKERGEGNKHPTVKPIKLMRYLCRLITPPNGLVLDPFMGSGTTGIAVIQEGFDFCGFEKNEDYFKIAEERIKYD